jgi:hypothetical protein
MKKARVLLAMTLILCLGLMFTACSQEVNSTLFELEKEARQMDVTQSSGEFKIDVTLSSEAASLLDTYEAGYIIDILDYFNFSYETKSDATNMLVDAVVSYNKSGKKPLLELRLNADGMFLSLDDLLAYVRELTTLVGVDTATFDAQVEALQGKSWLYLPFDAATSEYLTSGEYKELANLINDTFFEYLAGLDNEVFADYDSGLVKSVKNGYQFSVTYEQLPEYVEEIGTYIIDHIADFVAYTKLTISNLTAEQLAAFDLTESDRTEIISVLDEFALSQEMIDEARAGLFGMVAAINAGASILNGSSLEFTVVRDGNNAFTSTCELFLNVDLTTLGFGKSTAELFLTESIKEIGSFTVESPPTADTLNIEDVEGMEDFSDAFGSMFNPYGSLYY